MRAPLGRHLTATQSRLANLRQIGGAQLSVSSAGHVPFRPDRVEVDGEVWGSCGRLQGCRRRCLDPFERSMSTFYHRKHFGLPVFRWADQSTGSRQRSTPWWAGCGGAGKNGVFLGGLRLGPRRRLLSMLDPKSAPILTQYAKTGKHHPRAAGDQGSTCRHESSRMRI